MDPQRADNEGPSIGRRGKAFYQSVPLPPGSVVGVVVVLVLHRVRPAPLESRAGSDGGYRYPCGGEWAERVGVGRATSADDGRVPSRAAGIDRQHGGVRRQPAPDVLRVVARPPRRRPAARLRLGGGHSSPWPCSSSTSPAPSPRNATWRSRSATTTPGTPSACRAIRLGRATSWSAGPDERMPQRSAEHAAQVRHSAACGRRNPRGGAGPPPPTGSLPGWMLDLEVIDVDEIATALADQTDYELGG